MEAIPRALGRSDISKAASQSRIEHVDLESAATLAQQLPLACPSPSTTGTLPQPVMPFWFASPRAIEYPSRMSTFPIIMLRGIRGTSRRHRQSIMDKHITVRGNLAGWGRRARTHDVNHHLTLHVGNDGVSGCLMMMNEGFRFCCHCANGAVSPEDDGEARQPCGLQGGIHCT